MGFFHFNSNSNRTSDQTPRIKCLAKPPSHWTAIPLRSWRSRIFSKIIPNHRGSVDSHTILGLDASSTLPLRFYYASVTLLLRFHYDDEDLATLSLRWWWCSCDLATTLAMELRFCCAFVSFLYRIWNSDTLLLRPGRFYCALAVSATGGKSPDRVAVYASAAIWNNLREILDRHECSGIAVQWNGGFSGTRRVIADKLFWSPVIEHGWASAELPRKVPDVTKEQINVDAISR